MFKVVIIGPGSIAGTYAEALKDSETVKITAVLGHREESAKAFSQRYSVPYYLDAEEMYSTEKPDAVLICTPTFTHEELVKKAVQKGVHIMCEKPFVLDAETAQQLFSMAEGNNVRIMVMQVVRFWPEYVKIKQIVDSGTLGGIINVYANRLSAHPDWCSWHKDPQKSGGGLYDLHIHDIDYLYHLFGRVDTVYATGKQTDSGCWNNVSTILNFACGVSAVAEGFMDITGAWPFSTNLRINGTEAALEYINKQICTANGENYKADSLTVYPKDSEVYIARPDRYNPYRVETEYFANCVMNNKPNDTVPSSDVVNILRILSAIEKSLSTGTVQQVE